jgi:hypothetical protein
MRTSDMPTPAHIPIGIGRFRTFLSRIPVGYAPSRRFFHQVAGTSWASRPATCLGHNAGIGGGFVLWGTLAEIRAKQTDEGGEVNL